MPLQSSWRIASYTNSTLLYVTTIIITESRQVLNQNLFMSNQAMGDQIDLLTLTQKMMLISFF